MLLQLHAAVNVAINIIPIAVIYTAIDIDIEFEFTIASASVLDRELENGIRIRIINRIRQDRYISFAISVSCI